MYKNNILTELQVECIHIKIQPGNVIFKHLKLLYDPQTQNSMMTFIDLFSKYDPEPRRGKSTIRLLSNTNCTLRCFARFLSYFGNYKQFDLFVSITLTSQI